MKKKYKKLEKFQKHMNSKAIVKQRNKNISFFFMTYQQNTQYF